MWAHITQQLLPSKAGKGRINHVSDFASIKGWIRYTDPLTGEFKQARTIIHPGKNGDPWWETTRLLE